VGVDGSGYHEIRTNGWVHGTSWRLPTTDTSEQENESWSDTEIEFDELEFDMFRCSRHGGGARGAPPRNCRLMMSEEKS